MLVSLDRVGHAFVKQRFLFRGVTRTFDTGRLSALVGPSGSGKSTLLAVIAGWIPPTEGIVERRPGTRTCWVFQNPSGVSNRSVLDHVSLPFLTRGSRRREADIQAQELLDQFGLSAQAAQDYSTLSGGEGQRLMLARAVASAPDLILVDEPTAQLDATSATAVVNVLDALSVAGAGVIIATHDPRVRDHCHDVVDLTHHASTSAVTTPRDAAP